MEKEEDVSWYSLWPGSQNFVQQLRGLFFILAKSGNIQCINQRVLFGWKLLKLPLFKDLMICIIADFERKMPPDNFWSKFEHSDISVVAGPLEAVEAADPLWPLSPNFVHK